jgi:hypothetical protein
MSEFGDVEQVGEIVVRWIENLTGVLETGLEGWNFVESNNGTQCSVLQAIF